MAPGEILFPEHFPQEVFRPSVNDESLQVSNVAGLGLDELERRHIVRILKETNYNKSRAAEKLGIDRATLYRKASRFGIDLTGKL
jgi:two-component system response regulator AtoC